MILSYQSKKAYRLLSADSNTDVLCEHFYQQFISEEADIIPQQFDFDSYLMQESAPIKSYSLTLVANVLSQFKNSLFLK